MQDGVRWIVAIVALLSIVALLAFARGGAERHNPDAAPVAMTIQQMA